MRDGGRAVLEVGITLVPFRRGAYRKRRAMELRRSSGLLLHPTSLPGGRFGEQAYRFVDWLAQAGQSWWQVLPLGPPDEYGSPYRSPSAFAGWTGLLSSRGRRSPPRR